MQIKTFTAGNMKDVMSKIKTDLGPDAVILSTREVSDGTFGSLSKAMVEVTAAIDYDAELYDAQNHHAPQHDQPAPDIIDLDNPLSDTSRLEAEIADLSRMMKSLLEHSGLSLKQDNPLMDKLLDAGIRPRLAELMLDKMGQKADATTLRGLLEKIIRTADTPQQKVWCFLGTTGVGKTTTVAKIAAHETLKKKKKVGIITLDTYRIGAVEQTRTYAKILDIPFVPATTPEEFKEAVNRLADKDLILVDTVGRSAFHANYISQMKKHLHDIPACKFLLLPVATRDEELDGITKNFSALGIDRIIFTKTDEAVKHGAIISHNLLYRTPLAYLTTGQRVPEDIEPAVAQRILDLCLGDLS